MPKLYQNKANLINEANFTYFRLLLTDLATFWLLLTDLATFKHAYCHSALILSIFIAIEL